MKKDPFKAWINEFRGEVFCPTKKEIKARAPLSRKERHERYLSNKFRRKLDIKDDEIEKYTELSELNKLSPGIYEFVVVAESENNSYSFSFNLNYKNEISVSQSLISPENNSEKLNLFPELKWEKNENIDKFRLQVSKKEDFTNLELDETLYNNSYQLSDLNSDQVYFWRVQPINVCGTGDFSFYNIF